MTVSAETVAVAEQEVARGRSKSVSAWIDSAMREKAHRGDLVDLVAQMGAENGPATAEGEA